MATMRVYVHLVLVCVFMGGSASAGAESQILHDRHTANVQSSVQRILESNVLTPEQELATQAGLEAFLDARSIERSADTSRPIVKYEADPEINPRLKNIFKRLDRQRRPWNKTGGLFAYGSLVCLPGNELVLGGRFIVTVSYQNLQGSVFVALACQLTRQSGYFYFFDRTNVEIPIKMLNACFGGAPPTHWVFAAGLTNFGVEITIFDAFTGVVKSYRNPTGSVFASIIDQQTPFPCP